MNAKKIARRFMQLSMPAVVSSTMVAAFLNAGGVDTAGASGKGKGGSLRAAVGRPGRSCAPAAAAATRALRSSFEGATPKRP